MNTEVTLPSGAILTIAPAPFADAKELFMAVSEESKSIRLDMNEHTANLYKDLFCAAVSSKKIEAALAKCMSRCLYDGQKIIASTWEPIAAREDYMKACLEVAKENTLPFVKSLYAEFSPILGSLATDLASRPETKQS